MENAKMPDKIQKNEVADRVTERDKALAAAMSQIEKQFGKGSVMKLGDRSERVQVPAISTGSLSLDAALGIGGLPRGRIVEIYGPEGGGKTTLALQAIAEAQKAGGRAAFIDAEHALDPVYAKSIGVDVDELIISQPDYAEQALEIADMLVQSGGLDVFALDSVAALVPRAELEGMMGDQFVGLQARLMSQALRKLTGVLNKSQTCAIFINQLREKIGVTYGNPEVTPGGRALKFYSSVRLEVRRVESITEGDAVIGNKVKVKVVKNKMAPPYRVAQFDVIFGKGIQTFGEVVDLAVQFDIIEKSGSWYALWRNETWPREETTLPPTCRNTLISWPKSGKGPREAFTRRWYCFRGVVDCD